MNSERPFEVFISSRPEHARFVAKLTTSLKECGFSIWNELNKPSHTTAGYQMAVSNGIMSSAFFLFVLTPDSLVAETTLVELHFASKYHKKIITLVLEKPTVDNEQIFGNLFVDASLNVNFEAVLFEDSLANLVKLLRFDLVFRLRHTEYLLRAMEWKMRNKRQSDLLKGSELVEAIGWLSEAMVHGDGYCVLPDQSEWILQSRKSVGGLAADVFMIYSPTDEGRAKRVWQQLVNWGLTSWFSLSEIRALGSLGYNEKELIDASDIVLFFLSEASSKQDWLVDKLVYALGNSKKVIVLRLNTAATVSVPRGLAYLPNFDFSEIENPAMLKKNAAVWNDLHFELLENKDLCHFYSRVLPDAILWSRNKLLDNLLLSRAELLKTEMWLSAFQNISDLGVCSEFMDFMNASEQNLDHRVVNVYLSFSPIDKIFASRILQDLRRGGRVCELDVYDKNASLLPNDGVLEACFNVIVVISGNSANDLRLREIVIAALAHQKRVVCVCLDPIACRNLPTEFGGSVVIDFSIFDFSFPLLEAEIVRVLDKDLAYYTAFHTWQTEAFAWERSGFLGDRLLPEKKALSFSAWIDASKHLDTLPVPTALMVDFAQKSLQTYPVKKTKSSSLAKWLGGLLLLTALVGSFLFVVLQSKLKDYKELYAKFQFFEATSLRTLDPTLGLQKAVELCTYDKESDEAYAALLQNYLSGETFYREVAVSNKEFYAADISVDNEYVVTASADNCAILSTFQGKVVAKLTHTDFVWAAKFAPDGASVATCSQDMSLKIWDTSGLLLHTIQTLYPIYDFVFSRNGDRVLLGCSDGNVRIYTLGGELLQTIQMHEDAITSIMLAPDSSDFMTLGSDSSLVLATMQGEVISKIHFDKMVNAACFGKSVSEVYVAGDKSISGLWSWDSRLLKLISPHVDLKFVAFGMGGYLVTADVENKLGVWNSETINLITNLKRNAGDVKGVVVSQKDGLVLSTHSNANRNRYATCVWDLHHNRAIRTIRNNGYFSCTAFSSPSNFLAVASLNKIEIFDKNFVLFKTIAVQGRVNAMVFLPLGDFLWVGMANGKLLNFTIQGKTRNSVLEFQTLNSLAYDPHSNLLIAAGIDSKIALWEKGSVGVRKLQGHNGAINKLKFSADGSFFVSVSDDSTAVIWNKDGDRQAVLRGHSAEVASVAISPDGETIYTVGADSCLIKWDTSGNELARIHAHNAPIADIAVSPDGKYIASSSLGDGCKIWNASLGLLFEYPRESKDIYNSLVSFSPDGRYLLLSRENTVTQLGEVVILPIDMNFILQIIRDEVLDGQTFTEAVF